MKKKLFSLILALLFLLTLPIFSAAEGEEAVPGERVNFLVAGIDRRADGTTTSGTMVHADAIIVVSVDFAGNKVDLISVPRDTFVRVPGHKGFYKINAAFNVGGGLEDPESGFMALAATAGEVLGGISIPYYIAVDIASLEQLVDAVGGVDMEVEMSYTTSSGHRYEAGYQHLDGVGFVDYVRVRKHATVGKNDVGRTNRQRQALLALYKTVKSNGIITSLPSILSSVKEGVWTNISLTQMASLANFALGFDPEALGMHSMPGTIKVNNGWAYHFFDQQARKELILSVFGMEVGPYGIDSESFADYLHSGGFSSRKIIAMAEMVFGKLEEQLTAGTALTDEQTKLYTEAYIAYEDTVNALDAYEQFLITYCDGVPTEQRETRKALKSAVSEAQKACKKATMALGKTLGIKNDEYQWVVWPVFYKDTDINEIFVDFN